MPCYRDIINRSSYSGSQAATTAIRAIPSVFSRNGVRSPPGRGVDCKEVQRKAVDMEKMDKSLAAGGLAFLSEL